MYEDAQYRYHEALSQAYHERNAEEGQLTNPEQEGITGCDYMGDGL
jgi:hypothetical protein